MAQHPTSQFDPLATLGTPYASAREGEADPIFAGRPVAGLSATILEDGTGNVSTDVALDLVLTDVVEQARLATGASAAAVALRRGSEIFCRATSGPNAPELGSRLDQYSGLSGACVQSKTFQKCDDSDSDPRVDATLCHRLGVRSILVSPISIEGRFLGVVEVFSPKPNAFSDREVQTVQALSRIIVHNVEHLARAAEAAEPLPESLHDVVEPKTVQSEIPAEPEIVTEPIPVGDELPEVTTPVAVSQPIVIRSDHWTTVLIGSMIVVALALGWLVGHVGQKRSTIGTNPTASRVQAPSAPAVQAPDGRINANSEKRTQATASAPLPAPGSEKGKATAPGSAAPALGNNDLVVYRDGKVVYREPTDGPTGSSSNQNSPVFVSSEVANQLLIRRVEPDYPEQARERQIQGPVTLQLTVDKDGVVQSTTVVNGDDRLASAATAALRQWRFKPFMLKSKAEAFQTDVTVEFRLR